jgi:hypothetical protein
VILTVFKTGGRHLSVSSVGSTPTRFRHFSTTDAEDPVADAIPMAAVPVPLWHCGGFGNQEDFACNRCSIKGNVKENTCPSTGSEEQSLDFQPLLAMEDA